MKTNNITKKINNIHKGPKKTDHLAINELMNTLKKISNLNNSWKKNSSNLSKAQTGILIQCNQLKNDMTQCDVDCLFMKSKQKVKFKTEISFNQIFQNEDNLLRQKDLTKTDFLYMEDQYDKYLSGLPSLRTLNKQNMFVANSACRQYDLTSKFKQDYAVGSIIGQGAYAMVRVAMYKPLNKKMAIKAYQKHKIKDLPRKKTVKRQIKILQMLNHQNIVKIIDVVQTNNHLNIVMEYLSGISLGESLRQQPGRRFTEVHCKKIIRRIAHALSYLHSKNIAHRDIKLENIILDDSLSPKLIDFGFSTCIKKDIKIKIFCGTPSYMAPEIVQKTQYRGEAADIWALGVVMFVMLNGYFPYRANTDQQLFRKINNAEYNKHDISHFKHASNLISKIFTISPDLRIDANDILNHPWLKHEQESIIMTRKPLMQIPELTKLKTNSQGKLSQKILTPLKSLTNKVKKSFELANYKNLNRTIGQLNKTMNNRIKKQKKSTSIKKQSISNYVKNLKINPRSKIGDIINCQFRRTSAEKPKCKSQRG